MESPIDQALSKLLEPFVGWRYLGNNNHKAENPETVLERNKALRDGQEIYADSNDKSAWSLNMYWFNAFGYARLYPPFEEQCICGKELPKYNSYFYNPETSEVKCLGSGCASKLLGIFRQRGILNYKTKVCPLCSSKHKRVKSELCKSCSEDHPVSYWCKVCNLFVFSERIKKQCVTCLEGFDYVKHPCYNRDVFTIKCGHYPFKCPDCNTHYYKRMGHVCGEGIQCYRCQEHFDYEHQCEKLNFKCLKCDQLVTMKTSNEGYYRVKCPKCPIGYYEVMHTCYMKVPKGDMVLNACYCESICKVCFGIGEHDCKANQGFLKMTCDKPKYRFANLFTIYLNDQAYLKRWFKEYDNHCMMYYFTLIKRGIDDGYITLEEVNKVISNLKASERGEVFKKPQVTKEKLEGQNAQPVLENKRYFYCEACKHKIKNGYYYRLCEECKGWIALNHECDGVKRPNKPCKCGTI